MAISQTAASAHELGDMFTVTVGDSVTVTASALSYAYSVLKSETASENQKLAVSALYEYYNSAIAYQQ